MPQAPLYIDGFLKMVHGTLSSYDIIYVYEVSSNYFHLLKSYALDKEMLQTDGWIDKG